MIALGRLGWSLRKIEAATGVRRETAGGYLRSAGIAIRTPGSWGRKAPEAAPSVTTGSDSSKPANEVITGFSPSRQGEDPKPANEVITGFLPDARLPEQGGKRPCGASEAYRELIELELSRGRNAMGIWQLCRDRHSCQNAEFSTMPSRGHLAREFVLQTPIVTGILRGPFN